MGSFDRPFRAGPVMDRTASRGESSEIHRAANDAKGLDCVM